MGKKKDKVQQLTHHCRKAEARYERALDGRILRTSWYCVCGRQV